MFLQLCDDNLLFLRVFRYCDSLWATDTSHQRKSVKKCKCPPLQDITYHDFLQKKEGMSDPLKVNKN